MLKKSKGNRFHQQGFIFSTFPINFIICLTPYRKASITGAFFIFKRKENIMGVRVVFPDMGKDPSVQLIEKTITENGTYDAITDGANGYSKVNVNVEGGGGDSDLSIATMTCTGSFGSVYGAIVEDVDNRSTGSSASETLHIILYKGQALIGIEGDILSTSGSIEDLGRDGWLVTGDCTVNFAKL